MPTWGNTLQPLKMLDSNNFQLCILQEALEFFRGTSPRQTAEASEESPTLRLCISIHLPPEQLHFDLFYMLHFSRAVWTKGPHCYKKNSKIICHKITFNWKNKHYLESTFLLVCKPEPATHKKKDWTDKHQNVVTMVTYWVVRLKLFLVCLLVFSVLYVIHITRFWY